MWHFLAVRRFLNVCFNTVLLWNRGSITPVSHLSVCLSETNFLFSEYKKRLASLSAKWRAPFRQRDERLRVFSSPSSNTEKRRVINTYRHKKWYSDILENSLRLAHVLTDGMTDAKSFTKPKLKRTTCHVHKQYTQTKHLYFWLRCKS